MKHKILIGLDDNNAQPHVFAELKRLLNESHEKYLTGLRLGSYLEQKLVTSGGSERRNAGKEISKMLGMLQYSIDLEEEANKLDMEFEMFQGELKDHSLKHLSAVADLMVIDRRVLAPFCGEEILADLVENLYCPVLVLPEDKDVESLLMVYDGSFSSIQTLKSFLSLFHPRLRSLPFSVLVTDPGSKKEMEKERVFIDYLKLFFNDIGVLLMDDDIIHCLERSVGSTSKKPMLLFGGPTGGAVLNCNQDNRQITDENPSFIFKGTSE